MVLACSKSSTPSTDANVDVAESDAAIDGPDIDAGPIECGPFDSPLRHHEADVLGNIATAALGVEVVYDIPPIDELTGRDVPVSPLTVELWSQATENALAGFDGGLLEAVETLLRRQLEEGELLSLQAAVDSGPEAVETSLAQVMLSPDFLLNWEVAPSRSLRPREMATRMSVAVWRDGPTDELVAAIDNPTEAARILFSDPRVTRGAVEFHRRWLDYRGDLPDMAEETSRYVANVFEREPTFDALLRSQYTFVNDALAEFYGFSERPGDAFVQVSLEPNRASLFAQGSMTSGQSIALRGIRIARDVLCGVIPDEPAGLGPIDPGPRPGMTGRERYESSVADFACAGCHELFDPYGFALENYGPDGAYRTTDNGFPVDATFEAADVDGARGPRGEGIADLTNWLARSDVAHQCYARQWVRYVTQIDDPPACALDLNHEPGTTIPNMLGALATSDAIRSRSAAAPIDEFTFRPDNPDEPAIITGLRRAAERAAELFDAARTPQDRQYLEALREAYREQIIRRSP